MPRGACVLGLEVGGTQVCLSLDTLAAYEADTSFTGMVVGRVANRINQGRFILDGVEHQVPANSGPHALHGGPGGFHTRDWSGTVHDDGIEFTLISPDGDMGFPGEVTARVRYRISGSQVTVEYSATTTAPTPINLTQHTYFNLSGGARPTQDGDIRGHLLQVRADQVLEVDRTMIPRPGITNLDGHDLDLRVPRRIGSVRNGRVDHGYRLTDDVDAPAAVLTDPVSGRTLEIFTDAPGIQVYTGEFLPRPFSGVALETQRHPDAPNRPDFGDPTLRPGQTWRSTTRWRFTNSTNATDRHTSRPGR